MVFCFSCLILIYTFKELGEEGEEGGRGRRADLIGSVIGKRLLRDVSMEGEERWRGERKAKTQFSVDVVIA